MLATEVMIGSSTFYFTQAALNTIFSRIFLNSTIAQDVHATAYEENYSEDAELLGVKNEAIRFSVDSIPEVS